MTDEFDGLAEGLGYRRVEWAGQPLDVGLADATDPETLEPAVVLSFRMWDGQPYDEQPKMCLWAATAEQLADGLRLAAERARIKSL